MQGIRAPTIYPTKEINFSIQFQNQSNKQEKITASQLTDNMKTKTVDKNNSSLFSKLFSWIGFKSKNLSKCKKNYSNSSSVKFYKNYSKRIDDEDENSSFLKKE
jgi:hypothetical protein